MTLQTLKGIAPTIELLDDDCLELNFKGHSLRLTKTPASLKWIAKDLCLALRLSNAALNKVPAEFKDLVLVHKDTNGQQLLWKEPVITVNQHGLEYLISIANKRTALEFQKWYYEEALPSICKTA